MNQEYMTMREMFDEVHKSAQANESLWSDLNKILPTKYRIKFHYKIEAAHKVPRYIRAAAQDALDRSVKKLKLKRAGLLWMSSTSRSASANVTYGEPIRGRAIIKKGCVMVRWDIPIDEVIKTVAHEIFHLRFAQALKGKFAPGGRVDEARAERFAEGILAEIKEHERKRGHFASLQNSYVPPR